MSRDRPAIAVSGVGVVSGHGADLEAHRAAYREGRCVLREVDRAAGYHRENSARSASLVDASCYREVLPPMKARRMSPPSRFSMVAALAALEDAGLSRDALAADHGGDVTAVVFGTSYGPSSYTERILRQILLESPQAASPMLFTESVANAPAAQVALALGCKGPNITVTQREASALVAVGQGAALIRSGRARRALVGGVEELNPLLHSILDRFGALTGSRGMARTDAADPEARPLDLRRSGFVAAEGAAVLVLERTDDLLDRAGRARALVGPMARAFDPEAPATGWGRTAPTTARRLLSEWRRQGGVEGASELAGVVAGANGSRRHDLFESGLLREVMALPSNGTAGRDPTEARVLTPKRFMGEQGVATLVGALLALEGNSGGSPSGFEVDPLICLVPSDDRVQPGKLLLSAAAAGGSCCWLGLESP